MKIRRVRLEDFGVFRGQTIDRLSGSLVVIAGPNRAGKTTFMHALRYLISGLESSAPGLPPCLDKHSIDCDVVDEEDLLHNIRLRGFSAPAVVPVNHRRRKETAELYGGLDGRTYRELFTISLDELQCLAGVDAAASVILLGGGWNDALLLEQAAAKFEKEAGAIGGRRGDVKVKQFKPYWEKIEEGLAQRSTAAQMCTDYYRGNERLKEVNESIIPRLQEEIQATARQARRLELLAEHYRQWRRKTVLEGELSEPSNAWLLRHFPAGGGERARQLQEQYRAAAADWEDSARACSEQWGEDWQKQVEALLAVEDDVEAFRLELSGLKEGLHAYRVQAEQLRREQQDLTRSLKRINAAWDGKLEVLETLGLDNVEESLLREKVGGYGETVAGIRAKERELGSLKGLLEQAEQALAHYPRPRTLPRWAAAAGGITVAIGIAIAALVDLNWGIVAAAPGPVLLFYRWLAGQRFKESSAGYQKVEARHEELAGQYRQMLQELQALEELRCEQEPELRKIGGELGLPGTVAFVDLPAFHYRLGELKQAYLRWREKAGNLDKQRRRLEEALGGLRRCLAPLGLTFEWDADLSEGKTVLAAAERVLAGLVPARKLMQAEEKKSRLRREIAVLLAEVERDAAPKSDAEIIGSLSEILDMAQQYELIKQKKEEYAALDRTLRAVLDTARVRELFQTDDEEVVAAFGHFYRRFVTEQEVNKELRLLVAQEEDLTGRLEQVKEERAKLQQQLEELASDRMLAEANMKIASARNGLEPLAERYGLLRAASFLATQLKERLLEGRKEALLSGAGQLFRQVTGGDYQGILPPEDLHSPEFFTRSTAGQDPLPLGALSRATREQLFLSIRASRIMEIKPPLPVIFDDSFVNFDPRHCRQAVGLIAHLCRTHQVFLLTCHGELLEEIAAQGLDPQFWGLDNGVFQGPYGSTKELRALLEP